MRFNFFSFLLVLLTCASFGKVLSLFDRVMIKFADVEVNATTFFTLQDAMAAKTSDDKITKELKDKKKDNNSSAATNSVPDAKNLLDFNLSGDEIQLLQELQSRRNNLDDLEKKLVLKDNVLKNTEHKIQTKIAELKKVEDRVNDLINKLTAKNNIRIKSLAKIYENMKPNEAAKIFNELDMTVLLEIIKNMKEAKVGPVIAQMNPIRAREISLEFAKINDEITQVNNK